MSRGRRSPNRRAPRPPSAGRSPSYIAFEPGGDPEDVDAAHERFLTFRTACQKAAKRFGGVELPTTGTAFLACFGYPVAREDAARSAVRAGLEIAGDAIRAAVHTGPAVVTEAAGRPEVVGDVVNVVARLDAFCPPGGVLVTGAARRLVAGYFACEPMGENAPCGQAAAVELFRVGGAVSPFNRVEAADPAQLT